jgi:CBS domain containing-hemolysin-like protein
MTALLVVLALLLVFLNAFFVIAEYSLVRSSKGRLEADVEEGKRGARLAVTELDEIGNYISATQVGVTMTSLGVGALGEPAVAHALEPGLGGPLAHGAAVAIAAIIAYILITSVHIVIGELVPKFYAIGHAEGVMRRVARPLRLFRILFHPFIVVLNGAASRILRVLGADPGSLREDGGTPEELKRLIAESYTGGKLDPSEAGMLVGVFHLHEQEARQVMTPIPAVVTVDLSEDVETALRRCISSGHTRLVVTEDENRDRVKGVVHSNPLAQQLLTEGPHASIESLVRPAPIVPETKPLDDLLADLQRDRSTLAVVIDEYGRTAGIVTVEDIIEEIVGEIDDETDPAGGAVRRLANGDWFVRGHVAVTDLEDYGLELPVDTDAYNSVGGFVFAQLGRLPKRGDTITANGYSIRVESVRENRIEAVRIRERRAATSAASSEAE